jgi:hypothetical protein
MNSNGKAVSSKKSKKKSTKLNSKRKRVSHRPGGFKKGKN